MKLFNVALITLLWCSKGSEIENNKGKNGNDKDQRLTNSVNRSMQNTQIVIWMYVGSTVSIYVRV